MNRFNRNLRINIAEDTINTNQSPNHPHEERQFRPFEEHNEQESQKGQLRMNLIQFQEFTVQKPRVRNQKEEKRQFVIEIPDSKMRTSQRFKQHNLKNDKETDDFKQPPAPSKGSTKTKVFVFPSLNQQKQLNSAERQKIYIEFEKERQQFYKQKSKYEKELLIKDGQIQMLQKIVTEKYGSKRFANFDQRNLSEMENILVEKDVQINQLLEKINTLSLNLQRKSEEINKIKYQNSQLQTMMESLKDQLYIYEKKQNIQILTRQFRIIHQETSKRGKWQEEQQARQDFGIRGISELQKRLQFLKLNRMQMEERGKIKSEIAYSQTTKNKSKGIFDFKGRVYGQNSRIRNPF